MSHTKLDTFSPSQVTAAFNRGETNFGRGKANFALYGRDGINEAIKKGTAYMNVWMYVIREMEDAYDDCIKGCDTAECKFRFGLNDFYSFRPLSSNLMVVFLFRSLEQVTMIKFMLGTKL